MDKILTFELHDDIVERISSNHHENGCALFK